MTNDFRRWMLLVEANTFTLQSADGDTRVWQNPTRTAIQSLLNRFGLLRGIAESENYWVWDAMASTHHAISEAMAKLGWSEDAPVIFWITPPGFSPDDEPVPNSHYTDMELMSENDAKLSSMLVRMFHTRR